MAKGRIKASTWTSREWFVREFPSLSSETATYCRIKIKDVVVMPKDVGGDSAIDVF